MRDLGRVAVWQTVLERYQKGYDTREKMGVLTFSDLEFNGLSADAVAVSGRWHLKRATDEPHGSFTLIFAAPEPAGGSFTITHRPLRTDIYLPSGNRCPYEHQSN